MRKKELEPPSFPWEDCFDQEILTRGWNYYLEGAVEGLSKKSDQEYTAVVQGSVPYNVGIDLREGIPVSMSCDCPYAERGFECKHMAAVLFAVEDEKEQSGVSPGTCVSPDEGKTIESIVARIPENEIRDVLVDLCKRNEEIGHFISLRYSEKNIAVRLKELSRDLERIVREYSDKHGFVHWRDAGDLELAVEGFLTDNTSALTARGEAIPAFRMVNDTMMRIGELDIDDDGHLCRIASVICECWSSILNACSAREKRELFQWFSDHAFDKRIPYYAQDVFRTFYEDEFQERDLLERKLKQYQVTGPLASRDDYGEYYEQEHRVMVMFSLMEKLSCPEDSIREQIERFYQLPCARQFAIDHAIKQGDTPGAIDLLRKSKQIDGEYAGLVRKYSAMLIELYKQEGRGADHKQELLFQIFNCGQVDLKYTNELKTVCEAREWEEYRSQILAARTCRAILYPLLDAEGMHEELLERITGSGSLTALDDHEKGLKQKYPEKVRDAYAGILKKAMDLSSDRGRYAALIRYLRKLRAYPGGKELAERIAAEWRDAYPRRRALLDELSKAGF